MRKESRSVVEVVDGVVLDDARAGTITVQLDGRSLEELAARGDFGQILHEKAVGRGLEADPLLHGARLVVQDPVGAAPTAHDEVDGAGEGVERVVEHRLNSQNLAAVGVNRAQEVDPAARPAVQVDVEEFPIECEAACGSGEDLVNGAAATAVRLRIPARVDEAAAVQNFRHAGHTRAREAVGVLRVDRQARRVLDQVHDVGEARRPVTRPARQSRILQSASLVSHAKFLPPTTRMMPYARNFPPSFFDALADSKMEVSFV